MNYFQAYLPSLDEAIVAAWDSQVVEAAETRWLAQALFTKRGEIFPRFADCYAQVSALPRGARRVLQRRLAESNEFAIPPEWRRKLAASLAGAALLLALGQEVAQAATIFVTSNKPGINLDGKCSLIEAIENANDTTGTPPHLDCAAGDPAGADTIELPKKTITLASVHNAALGATGLPVITSKITIEGNRAKIVRGPAAPAFRLMAVGSTGDLTLKKLTLNGGHSSSGGGGILNNDYATLTIENSTISGNSASFGGGIYNRYRGTMTIENSAISGNKAAGAPNSYYADAFGGGVYNRFGTVTIVNSAISGNLAVGGSDSQYSNAYGGGIHNSSGAVTVTNSAISGNKAAGGSDSHVSIAWGSGIYNRDGTLAITNSAISGNKAVGGRNSYYSGAYGGGISHFRGTVTIENSIISKNHGEGFSNNSPYTTTIISNSTISGNKANFGGGVENGRGYLSMTNSTISNNKAVHNGGGVYNRGTLTIDNSTISGNAAAFGAGVMNSRGGDISLSASTISGNTVDSGFGGGVFNFSLGGYISTLSLNRSLISGNKAGVGPEIANDGLVYADNFSLFGTNGDAGVVGFTPGSTDIVPGPGFKLKNILGPLKKNGGPTKTHALKPGSPALDAIPLADPNCTGTDQRGVSRPQGAGCDIGATEQ